MWHSLVQRRPRRRRIKSPPVSEGDPLSDVPPLVKKNILLHMPVKEAVRTSVLCRSWKDAWISIPEIVLRDEHCVSVWTDNWTQKNSVEVKQFKKIGDKIIVCTLGSITKFSISSSLVLSKVMDNWFPILARRQIEHLVIELDRYRIPLTFFSCHSLKHASLKKCIVEVPTRINGLEKLQTLHLNCCQISIKDLELLVASCPSLQNLALDFLMLEQDSELRINSRSLWSVHFSGFVKNLILETPNLKIVSITKLCPLDSLRKGSFVEDFIYLHGLERLEMSHAYMLELVEDPPLETFPFRFSNLREIQIEMNPGDHEEAGFVLALLCSADKLQRLTLMLCSGKSTLATNWWTAKANRNLFKHLEIVKLFYLTPSEFEYSFLAFLMLSAPVLHSVYLEEVSSSVDLEELQQLEKISEDQVFFCRDVLDS